MEGALAKRRGWLESTIALIMDLCGRTPIMNMCIVSFCGRRHFFYVSQHFANASVLITYLQIPHGIWRHPYLLNTIKNKVLQCYTCLWTLSKPKKSDWSECCGDWFRKNQHVWYRSIGRRHLFLHMKFEGSLSISVSSNTATLYEKKGAQNRRVFKKLKNFKCRARSKTTWAHVKPWRWFLSEFYWQNENYDYSKCPTGSMKGLPWSGLIHCNDLGNARSRSCKTHSDSNQRYFSSAMLGNILKTEWVHLFYICAFILHLPTSKTGLMAGQEL